MSSLDAFGSTIDALVAPIIGAAEEPEALSALAREMGVSGDYDQLLGPLRAVAEMHSSLEALLEEEVTLDTFARVLDSADRLFATLSGSQFGELDQFGRDLLLTLITTWLRTSHPVAHALGVLLCLIEPMEDRPPRPPQESNGLAVRGRRRDDGFHLDRLVPLVRDPVDFLKTHYLSSFETVEDAEKVANKLFGRLSVLMSLLGISCRYGIRPEHEELVEGADLCRHSLIVYTDDLLCGADAEAGAVFSLSPPESGDLGLVACPFGALAFTREVSRWTIASLIESEIPAVAWGRHGVTLLADTETAEVAARIVASRGEDGADPAVIWGSTEGTRLQIGHVELAAATRLSEASQDLLFSADLKSCVLVIDASGSDGFLASILPSEGLTADFDLRVAWSNVTGLTIGGGAGLEATLPIGATFGGLSLSAVHIGLRTAENHLHGEVSAILGASLGPVRAVIDRLGVEAVLSFPEGGGSLAVADLEVRGKLPSGVGLVIEAGGLVTGGGFLSRDEDQHLYAGAFELTLATLSVKAIVILKTKIDGAPFALLAMVYARWPGGVELGFRFTLNAVGGMIGINHRFDYQALVEALPSGAMDAILFPDNPVADAPRIISSLTAICPVQPGAYTLMLMAELGWGSDYICALRLGIILPLNDIRRIYLVGQVRVQCFRHLPEEIRLQLICDTLGEIGFDPFSMRIDGRLRDSRFGPIGIEGQLVLVLTTGSDPRFLIAAGGFHPNFKSLPPGLPSTIDRLAVNYDVGAFKAWFKGYFAVAAGTVQFGAEIGCRYKAGSLAFTGNLGIDALIHLEPFMFEAEAHFNVAVEYRGHELFGVHVNATLWGPDHWRVKGHGSFSILFWDVGIDFDESWGDDVAPAAEPVALLSKAQEDLENDTYWLFEAPAAATSSVQFAAGEASAAAVHPLATLSYRQRRFPFGLDLDRIGSAPVEGPRSVPVPSFFDPAGNAIAGAPALDPFAIGEYVELSDESRLSRPSFEPLPSGATAGITGFRLHDEGTVQADVDYEQIFLPRRTKFDRGLNLEDLHSSLIRNLVSREAAGTSAVRAQDKLARTREPVLSEPTKWAATDPLDLTQGSAEVPTWAERSPAKVAELNSKEKPKVLVETFELAA